jgi:hypothetical protein
VIIVDGKLYVDEKEVVLNKLVQKMLGRTVAGAVTPLLSVEKD